MLERIEPVDAVEEREIVGVEEVGDGEEHPSAGGAQHVTRLGALEAGVQRHDHAAGGVDPERGDRPLRDVRRPDGDAVAHDQAGGDEGACRGVGRSCERRERPLVVAVSFVRSIVQGETLGVSIGQIMRDLATEMRRRRKQRAEERAQKAPIKILFPLVFLIFPAMFVVLLGPALVQFLHAIRGVH